MDSAVLVDKLLWYFSTEEGLQLLPILHEDIFRTVLYEFYTSDFSADDCRKYEDCVSVCLKLQRDENVKKFIHQEVIKSIVFYIDIIFRNLKKYDLFQVIRFFYGTWACLDSAETLHNENSLVVKQAVMLWQTCFLEMGSWKENMKKTKQFFSDMVLVVATNSERNPKFCNFLVSDLHRALAVMKRENKLTQQEHDHKLGNLYHLSGHCFYHLNYFELAIDLYKKASELFELNCYLSFELWAKTLLKQGKPKEAKRQLEFAFEVEKDFVIKRHLQDELDEIQKYFKPTQQGTSRPVRAWLDNSQIDDIAMKNTKAKEAKEAHQRKKKPKTKFTFYSKVERVIAPKQSKSKVLQVTPSLCYESKPAKHQLYPFYYEWETSGDESSGKEETDLRFDSDDEENSAKVGKIEKHLPMKTWFRESQDLYRAKQKDNQIACGTYVDVNIDSFLRKEAELQRPPFYSEARSLGEIQKLIKENPKQYKHCKIELKSPHEAVCRVLFEGQHSEIEIHGRSKIGQTFNQDEVCVEILETPKQRTPSSSVYGKVIGVMKTNFQQERHPVLACTCDSDEGFLMHPLCKSFPKIHVLNEITKKKNPSKSKYKIDVYKVDAGKLTFKESFDVKPGLRGRYVFVVVYLTWGVHHVYPLGAVVKVLECGTDFSGGMKILEMQYQVPSHFARDTVQHIDKMLKKVPLPSDQRDDCRDLTVFTIDPEHSKDLDDALSICKKENHFIVGVHIADVAAMVKKGDPVDKEAKKRATSFYPSESQVRHMLPEPLSEQLCSLLPNQERQALTVFLYINKSGVVPTETKVKKTLVKSCQQVSYEEAQEVIDGRNLNNVREDVMDDITLLHEVAQNLREIRMNDSRFAVAFEDPRFQDNKDIDTIEAQKLVEEFMIAANSFIAAWLLDKYPNCIPIRCQPDPPKEKLERFHEKEKRFIDIIVELQDKEVLPDTKIKAKVLVDKGNSVRKEYLHVQKDIWLQILDGIKDGKMKDAMKALCQDEVHPFQAVALDHWWSIMESAEYRCSVEPEKNLNHFSLQTKLYTHFTSPIRRYVDLVVHRLVHAALDDLPSPYSQNDVSEMCVYINDATARQNHFSNACQALRRAEKISQQPMAFKAFVSNVTDSGAELCIPSLKHISGRSKELPFNLMDFNKKPEQMQDANTQQMLVYGKWKKRLYDCTGCPQQLSHSEKWMEQTNQQEKFLVNPHQHVIHIDSQTWAKILNLFFSQETKRLRQMLRSQPRYGQNPPAGPAVTDVITSELGDGNVKFHHCRFEYCFKTGNVIKVQMVANPLKGILTPQVRLVHVSKNLSLCLTHMEDPVGVLSKYASESTKQNIESIADYQRIWLPLLEMEAATSAVCSEENVIIDNVKLHFKSQNGKREPSGEFILSSKFVQDRCIDFGGKPLEPKEEPDDENKTTTRTSLSTADYLCLRCPVGKKEFEMINKIIEVPRNLRGSQHFGTINQPKRSFLSRIRRKKIMEIPNPMTTNNVSASTSDTDHSFTWVGHGRIIKIKQKSSQDKKTHPDLIKVVFKLGLNTHVPRAFWPTTFGTVEVILKSVADRTTMEKLKEIESSPLACSIATTSSLPPLDHTRIHVGKMVLEKESVIGDLPLNNYHQLEAIRKALTSCFSLIQGPPGTGKTYTGLKLLYLFNRINKKMSDQEKTSKKKQVLFCGPSNKAVDLVARLMLKKLGKECPNIIRVYGSVHESIDYPIPKYKFVTKRSLRDSKSDPSLRDITLHHMVRKEENTKSQELKRYDRLFKWKPDAVKLDDIRNYKDLLFSACCDELAKCDIILCTCAVGGSIRLSVATNIQQVVIDECAMSTEPQSMVPIIASKAKQVVLIGDHKQLRPIIQCKEAAELGLDRSLFERYSNEATFLNIQYRMHPNICEFPSREFYEGKLKTGSSFSWQSGPKFGMWTGTGYPMLFCHVEGTEEALTVSTEEGNEQSKFNDAEVKKVVEVFKWLKDEKNAYPDSINMMSQYNAQCTQIRQNLKMTQDPHRVKMNVNTVVGSQGGEWDYVIFSTVRSLPYYKIENSSTLGWRRRNLGFITDQNQINVALTRARKGLIIVGNKKLLKCDDVFRKLISSYEEIGCLVDGMDFPPAKRYKR